MTPIELKIHSLLINKNKKIAVAESCTGGMLSSLLTRYAGSSRYFTLGVVTYSNQAKEDLLKIPPSLFAKNGAVSKPVASAMAKRIRIIAKADFGIGISGIAGPTGATANKPVGTVFIAIDNGAKTISKKFSFFGPRRKIMLSASRKSLELLNCLL